MRIAKRFSKNGRNDLSDKSNKREGNIQLKSKQMNNR